MNRPLSDIPDVQILGAWALEHWLDSPLITITTNQGSIRHEFKASNASQRTGCPYIFELPYVLTLYQADQHDVALQRAIRRGGE